MAQPPLLIIYQRAMRATAILLLHLPQVAGWLRLKLQAATKKQEIFDLLLAKLTLPRIHFLKSVIPSLPLQWATPCLG
jgi:hypothetical protein